MTALPKGIAPSILSADFDRLGEQVQAVLDAGAPVIHVDVMDGHFVPPITMGPLVVEALRDRVARGGSHDGRPPDDRPPRAAHRGIREGRGRRHLVHQEATPHVHYTLAAIRDLGAKAGLAICPGTPAEVLAPAAELTDLALCMTVNPGWGGQKFIGASPAKIARMRELLPAESRSRSTGASTSPPPPLCVEAGATLLVAGSAVFGAPDPAAALAQIASAAGYG